MSRASQAPSERGASVQDNPPASLNTKAVLPEGSAAEQEHNPSASSAQVRLSFKQSRILQQAVTEGHVRSRGIPYGGQVDHWLTCDLVNKGLLETFDNYHTYTPTLAGRAYLQAHPHLEDMPLVPLSKRPTPEQKAQVRREFAEGQLMLITNCETLGECVVCLGTGHKQPGRNRWEKYAGWQRLSDIEFECPTCGGTGRAPQSAAYREMIAEALADIGQIVRPTSEDDESDYQDYLDTRNGPQCGAVS